ncbi:MAG TPA: PhoPQ-activated pathogenicity-related family protein [Sedimentisphaerales bacterium]|nr:PhoPQ-activated pathogenicity-related family protein [Sedimentisphaerales bacterium]
MRKQIRFAIIAVLVFGVAQVVFATALDDYVAKPDASYKYTVVKTIEGVGYTGYVVDMVSQTWRSENEVDRTQWRHWLRIVKPANAKGDTALLYINGGSNRGEQPDSVDMMLGMMAIQVNSVIAELKMVPNQPLVFAGDGRSRSEDAIIAYTFDKYLETGDATWPLLLPMVKSAVRAMDTMQTHLKGLEAGAVDIKKFVVSGGSKRGWTTWLTAAVDKRVVAICPAVIDVLNMGESMRHHHAAYGFWAPAIHDYQENSIFDRLDTPRGKELQTFIDPYNYRDRYTMPKFLLNSSGDQFFLPDSAQFYFADLPGEKYVRYFPNTGHGLDLSAFGAVTTFYRSVLAGADRPKFNWTVQDDGAIVVECRTEPKEVKLWQATNPEHRDFRIDVLGAMWAGTLLEAQSKGVYVGKPAQPEKGWTAYFVELTFDGGEIGPYQFTTEVRVLPKTLPFAEKN